MWSPGQPDNNNAGEPEHCVEVRKNSDTSAEFNFNDAICDGSHGQIRNFVCQKRSTNTDLMEVTTDGITFETMDTKLPSNDDI